MYIHCKQGFIEVDRWDGTRLVTAPHHQEVIDKLVKRKRGPVMVVRSRRRETIEGLLKGMRSKHEIWNTPTWDYQFRVYLTTTDFANAMARVLAEIDYRNFKHWTHANAPDESKLAHDIWQVANDAAKGSRGGRHVHLAELHDQEIEAAHKHYDAKEAALDEHGYGANDQVGPGQVTGLAPFITRDHRVP